MITTPTMPTDTSSPNGHVRAVVNVPWTSLVTLRAHMNRGDGMAYETPVTIAPEASTRAGLWARL